MATNNTSPSNPRAKKMGDVLDALSSGIAKTAASEPKLEPQCLVPESPAEPARQLLTEIMLADRWVCSVARLQRWRTVGEGPQYLKIVGKVLYRLKDTLISSRKICATGESIPCSSISRFSWSSKVLMRFSSQSCQLHGWF